MAVTKIYTNKQKTKISWKVVVYIQTDQFDKFGNRIYKHQYVGCYATEREGKQAERDFYNKLEQGKLELNKNATCREVILFFLEFARKEGRYSKGTVANYECLHSKYLEFFDYVKIANITPALLRTWRRQMIEQKLSAYRINDCIKLLKSAFNYAIREKEISINPFKNMQNETPPPTIRHRFSTDQLSALLKSCKTMLPDYYCLFALACLTGMRVGEYTALKVEDIDFNNGFIYVSKQFTRGELKNRTKTASSTRTVHPSRTTLKIIMWHMKKYSINTGFLFPATNGNPVSAKWVSRRFRRLLTLNNYSEDFCRVHDLRGQYVDVQHAMGAPTEHISKEVGHSRTSTTSDIYTQILAEVPKEMNNRMDRILFRKSKKNSKKNTKVNPVNIGG